MYLLHNIGPRFSSNYNTVEEIVKSQGPLSFDGIYLSVYTHFKALAGRDITLFVMGDFIGGDNSFDTGTPIRERYCDVTQLQEMIAAGAKLGWHSWTHRDLTKLSDDDVLREITPSAFLVDALGKFKSFAYPYGAVDARVAKIVADSGLYEDAYSVHQGDGSTFQKKRRYLNW